jgi:hypothetical protein
VTIVFPEKFDFLDRNNSPTHRSTMTDSTEQFAEIMNKTIQEAAEADARAERLEHLLKAEREERALELDQKEQQIGNLQYELEQEQEEVQEHQEQLESLLDHRDALREENKELKAREKGIMASPCRTTSLRTLSPCLYFLFSNYRKKYIGRAKGLKGPKGVIYQSLDKIDRGEKDR